MSWNNSKKLTVILISTIFVFIVVGTILVFWNPDEWFWLLGSLAIGFIIVLAPLSRALIKELKREKQEQEKSGSQIKKIPPIERVTCYNCGYQLPSKSSYCDNCGQKVQK